MLDHSMGCYISSQICFIDKQSMLNLFCIYIISSFAGRNIGIENAFLILNVDSLLLEDVEQFQILSLIM